MAKGSYDVIVIGAGFGGSSCAALLAKRGLKVLLLEKNARAGGKAMALSKKGFTYTAWVVITAPSVGNKFEIVLKELGMEDKVELVTPSAQQASGDSPPDPLERFGLKEGEKEHALKLMGDIATMSPEDIDALDDISLGEFLSRYTVPRGLYANLVGPQSDGCFVVPADTVSASEAVRTLQDLIHHGGGLFAKGGIGRVAETFAEAVELNGGKAVMRARVERITVEQGQVTGVITDKGTFQAPIVVSNAGIQPTVLKLVGEEHFDKSYVNYVKDLVPSWGFMGARYFLNKKVIEVPFAVISSYESCRGTDAWNKTRAGNMPDEMTVWYEVPSNYDPDAAPPGKQIVLTGHYGPCDPQLPEKEKKAWWAKGDEVMFKAFPDLSNHIEAVEHYSAKEISGLTRDQVLPGIGGETIGLAQMVGQAGRDKPSVKAPVRGLFYVGCDAGGQGIGTQQAVHSGINVAQTVLHYHLTHQATQSPSYRRPQG
jgi:prolycopene isomerase